MIFKKLFFFTLKPKSGLKSESRFPVDVNEKLLLFCVIDRVCRRNRLSGSWVRFRFCFQNPTRTQQRCSAWAARFPRIPCSFPPSPQQLHPSPTPQTLMSRRHGDARLLVSVIRLNNLQKNFKRFILKQKQFEEKLWSSEPTRTADSASQPPTGTGAPRPVTHLSSRWIGWRLRPSRPGGRGGWRTPCGEEEEPR